MSEKSQATVREVMTRQPCLIDADSTILKAAAIMREHNLGSLPVGREDRLVGILTDRDIVVRAIAAGMDPDATHVKEIMTLGVLTCYDDDSLEQAADIMSDNDVRRLVVLDRDDRVIGVLSEMDVIKRPDSDRINDAVLHHLYKYA